SNLEHEETRRRLDDMRRDLARAQRELEAAKTGTQPTADVEAPVEVDPIEVDPVMIERVEVKPVDVKPVEPEVFAPPTPEMPRIQGTFRVRSRPSVPAASTPKTGSDPEA